nr:reverse transcriptase domain-containing protein [Tanacetum cinerariifolium]
TFLKFRDNIQGYVSAAAGNYNQGNPGYRPQGVANQMRPPGYVSAAAGNYNQGNPGYRPQGVANQMRPPGSGTLPDNTVANPKGELKAITTRSGLVTDGPTQEKYEIQIQKFWHMFKQLHLNITLDEALVLMPKYQKMLKALLSNKEKLQELENTPRNENCLAVILKKLPEKLGDPGKFLIPCGFSELKCKALANLGASINLMPLSVWKKLGLPDLILTRMTLELANRSICTPDGMARDVFVPVGKFTFPA